MLDRILEQKMLPSPINIGSSFPIIADPFPMYPLMLPKPKINGAAELTITRDGLDLKVAVSLDLGK